MDIKKKRVTIYDIAKKAGVSVGTVNRAINNKARISPATKKMVLDTAKKLGYKANPAAQGLRRLPIKIGAVLFCPIDEYVDSIVEGILSSASDLEKYNVLIDVKKLNYKNNVDCIKETQELIKWYSENNYQGIVLFMSAITDEMLELSSQIDELIEKGIIFATVANDIPTCRRAIYVGCNAFMAGQMAAQLLEFSCKKKDVALLVTSNNSPVNTEYIKGFMSYSGKNLFSSVKIYEHYDDESQVISVTDNMLQENPNLKGIYMATAASPIACNHLKKINKNDLTVITTDILSETRDILTKRIASATIFQNPYRQGRNVIKHLYTYIIENKDSGVHLIPPHIVLLSNLDYYLGNNQ